MKLITASQREKMLQNTAKMAASPEFDPKPVVKLYTLFAPYSWLLASFHPVDPDLVFGIADLGMGCAEFGYVSLTELKKLKGGFLPLVERDLYFKADRTLAAYLSGAQQNSQI